MDTEQERDKFTFGIKRIPFNAEMRKARERKRLTQGDLANLIGIPEQYISLIERVRRWPGETTAHQRIRQIETRALRKLRHPSRAKKLEPFL